MGGRFAMPVAVQALVLDGSRVLLARRRGSGHHDGEFGLPAGHVEGGESLSAALVREVAEEVGLHVAPGDVRLVLTAHVAPAGPDDREYLHAFFVVEGWSGEARICEPDKCDELRWAEVDDLPPDTVDHVAAAVRAWRAGDTLLERGWEDGFPVPGATETPAAPGDESPAGGESDRWTGRDGEGKEGRGVSGSS